MRQRKHQRDHKRQTGQYMTPEWLARAIVENLPLDDCRRILEPSCGDGAFLSVIADRFINEDGVMPGEATKDTELIGIEIEPWLAEQARTLVSRKAGQSGGSLHTEVRTADFFCDYMDVTRLQRESFDLIIGNPPFGGTLDGSIEDVLDKNLGKRLGKKIKKETYAFFIVACLDLLRSGGRLVFVCSNTLLTIPTMTGLRNVLMELGEVKLYDIHKFSDETTYPMLILDFRKGGQSSQVTRNSVSMSTDAIRSTPNLSWGITDDLARFFRGPLLGDYFIASSGMTTGKNELFVRKIVESHRIIEPYCFEFYDAPMTVAYEMERARLGKLSAKRRQRLAEAEHRGETERRVKISGRDIPLVVQLPDSRYRPYNTANNCLVFSKPTHYIFWEDCGDAVLTYKKTGNWYLRGVGGQPYFGKEGLTWPLVAASFIARYLPAGYILDSGAPCAFLREGIHRRELFFIIGWLLSPLANHILKKVINHTRNIQSKDFERMPYPWWVSVHNRATIVESIEAMIISAREGKHWSWNDDEVTRLGELFELQSHDNSDSLHALSLPTFSEQSALQHNFPIF